MGVSGLPFCIKTALRTKSDLKVSENRMGDIKIFVTAMVVSFAAVFLFTGAAYGEFKQPCRSIDVQVDPDFDPPLGALPAHPGIPADNVSQTNGWQKDLSVDENIEQMGPKQKLGYLLFFDTKLAGDPSLACADCHDPKQGWSFADAMSKGYPGSVHFRGSQTVVNAGYLQKFFWQAPTPSLEKQAPSAAHGAQSGNGDDSVMETRLRFTPEYVKMFNELYGTEWPHINQAWDAIAAFERWLSQTNTPFDRFMKGETGALSIQEKKGLELFTGKANCVECHNGSMFTDEKMYNLGAPQPLEYLESGMHQTGLRFRSVNKGVTEELYRVLKDDLMGYFNTKHPKHMGVVRTPPLRYIEFTAPYMHNGVFFTLEEVVDFYDKGGDENQWARLAGNKTKILNPLNLTDDEKEALVAFLLTLDDGEIDIPVPETPAYAPMVDWQVSKERVAEGLLMSMAFRRGE